jgi:hypothetical protein
VKIVVSFAAGEGHELFSFGVVAAFLGAKAVNPDL